MIIEKESRAVIESRAKKAREARIEPLKRWHNWFAWYPVRIDSKRIVWLSTVVRQARTNHTGHEMKISGWYYVLPEESAPYLAIQREDEEIKANLEIARKELYEKKRAEYLASLAEEEAQKQTECAL